MKILGLIPARGGSKGILGKNIKLLEGKPLLTYTWESANKSRLLSRIVLSSDDKEIIKVAETIGLEVPFERPSSLAQDDTPSIEVIKHALKELKNEGEEFEAICLLQPTTPFREEGLIDRAIEKFISGNYTSLISVREVPHQFNPHWVFEEKEGKLKIATGEKVVISRRQDLPTAYYRDGSIYVINAAMLAKQNSIYGEKVGFIKQEGSPNINLDDLEDWVAAENYLKSIKNDKLTNK